MWKRGNSQLTRNSSRTKVFEASVSKRIYHSCHRYLKTCRRAGQPKLSLVSLNMWNFLTRKGDQQIAKAGANSQIESIL